MNGLNTEGSTRYVDALLIGINILPGSAFAQTKFLISYVQSIHNGICLSDELCSLKKSFIFISQKLIFQISKRNASE